MISHLGDVHPNLSGDDIVANLVPPKLFVGVSFESYISSPEYPSQEEAKDALARFADELNNNAAQKRGLFSRKSRATAKGFYLDGGFGVGKTHLLASLWNAAPAPKAYGTFLEYTSLVGSLGFDQAVQKLQGYKLLCIDEFELDDPGDTMIMTRLLQQLAATGTSIVATSNTPPNALGEGRFGAYDFLREIMALSSIFTTLRIDGEDYRRRDPDSIAVPWEPHKVEAFLANNTGSSLRVSADNFVDVIECASVVHPVQYLGLAGSADVFVWRNVAPLGNQDDALRLVALIDRIYDEEVPIIADGVPLTSVFTQEMIDGGYQKKYLRCVSRLDALSVLAQERYGF